MKRRPTPITRRGWANYYATLFNKTEDSQALQLAMWYDLLALAFDEDAP